MVGALGYILIRLMTRRRWNPGRENMIRLK